MQHKDRRVVFYNPKDQKVIVSTNARFLEEDYIINHKPISKIVLEEIRGESPVSIPTVQEEIPQVAAPRVTSDTQLQTVPRRSGRVVRQPDRYMFLGESSDFIPGEHEPDPLTYDEALQDKDADSWHKAMKSEIESMYSNQVWELVEPQDGVKAIGWKLGQSMEAEQLLRQPKRLYDPETS
ncbi:uncharacterized protein LOC141812336 [Curcuma longa]|uniref:uncharacterized protein LOC141812336 n=1 Tax=Curcuma longa TaxID=136217 RepID=UPI003D9E3D39